MPVLLAAANGGIFTPFADLENAEDLAQTWRVFTKVKDSVVQGGRAENLSWRLWHLHFNKVTREHKMTIAEFKDYSAHKTVALEKDEPVETKVSRLREASHSPKVLGASVLPGNGPQMAMPMVVKIAPAAQAGARASLGLEKRLGKIPSVSASAPQHAPAAVAPSPSSTATSSTPGPFLFEAASIGFAADEMLDLIDQNDHASRRDSLKLSAGFGTPSTGATEAGNNTLNAFDASWARFFRPELVAAPAVNQVGAAIHAAANPGHVSMASIAPQSFAGRREQNAFYIAADPVETKASPVLLHAGEQPPYVVNADITGAAPARPPTANTEVSF